MMFRKMFLGKAWVLVMFAAMALLTGVIFVSHLSTVSAASQNNLAAFTDLRYGMFIHFNMGTFSDEEWASPNYNPTKFAPTNVDTNQWATVAKNAKMKFGILTTKHHDGFCLWPTASTSYNVMNSAYKQDIVKKYTDSFRAQGLKVGIYFSVWDKTHDVQAYNNGRHSVAGTTFIDQADIDYTLGQIRELLTNYGTIDIFVTDGYGWQAGQQAVPYQQIRNLVKSLQPNCIMIDHGALSVPFIGDAIYFEEPLGVSSPAGNTYASCQGQTISNGWFWHPSTPTTDPMSKASILSHLADLEPKYTTFILNCPPNRTGQLDTNIVNRLNEVAASWNPNTSRASLPVQQIITEYPITPRNAYATVENVGEWAPNAIDGRNDKDYQTCWSTWGGAALPQSITVDLGGVWSNVSTLEYLPRQWSRNESTDGDITSYTIYTSPDGINFTQKATGTWAGNNKSTKIAEWVACNVGYVRLQVNAATGGYANVSELRIGGRLAQPVLVNSTPAFDPNGYYRIVNYTSKLALDSGNQASGSSVKQGNCNDPSNNLQWQIIDLGTGYYKIINRANGLAIDGGGSVAAGSNLKMWTWDGSNNLQWQLQALGQGYYRFTNRTNGMVFDGGGAVSSGSYVKEWNWDGSNNLRWVILFKNISGTPTPTPTTGSYVRFRNVATSLYIDSMGSTSNGSNACQWSSSASNNQQWTLISSGSYVMIQNRATGLYLDGMGRTSNGSICGQWASSGSNAQQWTQETVGSYVKFKNRQTGLYMDGMGSTANGSNLCQWANSGSTNQQWQIQ